MSETGIMTSFIILSNLTKVIGLHFPSQEIAFNGYDKDLVNNLYIHYFPLTKKSTKPYYINWQFEGSNYYIQNGSSVLPEVNENMINIATTYKYTSGTPSKL